MTFTNILGQSLHMKVGSGEELKTLSASDWRVSFPVPDTDEQEKLQVYNHIKNLGILPAFLMSALLITAGGRTASNCNICGLCLG